MASVGYGVAGSKPEVIGYGLCRLWCYRKYTVSAIDWPEVGRTVILASLKDDHFFILQGPTWGRLRPRPPRSLKVTTSDLNLTFEAVWGHSPGSDLQEGPRGGGSGGGEWSELTAGGLANSRIESMKNILVVQPDECGIASYKKSLRH